MSSDKQKRIDEEITQRCRIFRERFRDNGHTWNNNTDSEVLIEEMVQLAEAVKKIMQTPAEQVETEET